MTGVRADALSAATAAAERAGVTRLADVTGLDVVGIPVFQAVRPWSRALSVHQGKGFTVEAAKIGALMEAVESAWAEAFAAETLVASFASLPGAERAPRLDDFACDRADRPGVDEPLAWTAARTLLGGQTLWVPFDVVSLDFSRAADARLERSSNGLGCRFSHEEACVVAVLELIERDALAAWRASSLPARSLTRMPAAQVPCAWYDELSRRLRAGGIELAIYLAPAVIGAPVFVCELSETGEPRPSAHVFGSACRPDPQAALEAAVLEALQSRLAIVSGARDDILLLPEAPDGAVGLGVPPPPGVTTAVWPGGFGPQATSSELAAALAAAGFGQTTVIPMAPAGGAVHVVKAVCPGLGSGARARRTGISAA